MLAVYHLDLSTPPPEIFAGKLSGTRKSPLLYFRFLPVGYINFLPSLTPANLPEYLFLYRYGSGFSRRYSLENFDECLTITRCETRPLELKSQASNNYITNILAGLRRHGNYNLRVRADINDVIAALAREAGWVVLPDGTTFPSRSQSQGTGTAGGTPSTMVTSSSSHNSTTYSTCFIERHAFWNSEHSRSDCLSNEKVCGFNRQTGSLTCTQSYRNVILLGTPYIPVYVMLPLGVINMKSELVDLDGLVKQLRVLKSINVDGVMVDCWWGIVEANAPQEYNWNGYELSKY
ncbi:hypothetical protein HAX54_034526 [Datura stramonium]|uniref:Beta-amylase n=1 Tax=Datura stramonium TaxID=4076 RepID=A0ABS8VE35_DATST|nr:hypothetical protein [Datura stramonium]